MEVFWEYARAFLCGGALCLIGQLLIDKTKLTPARILVLYVVSGVVLGGLGLYKYVVEFGGAGATVPLTGFGYLLAKFPGTMFWLGVEDDSQLHSATLKPDERAIKRGVDAITGFLNYRMQN
jgi:hypothetical protein